MEIFSSRVHHKKGDALPAQFLENGFEVTTAVYPKGVRHIAAGHLMHPRERLLWRVLTGQVGGIPRSWRQIKTGPLGFSPRRCYRQFEAECAFAYFAVSKQ